MAEFIDAALADDDIHFADPAYEATYQAYFELYDEGKTQEEIVLALLNGENRAVAAVAADLCENKYTLTVHNFSDALTTRDSWLVTFVPKAILAYHDSRLRLQQKQLLDRLTQDLSPEQTVEDMKRLSRINDMIKTVNIKLGRLKK